METLADAREENRPCRYLLSESSQRAVGECGNPAYFHFFVPLCTARQLMKPGCESVIVPCSQVILSGNSWDVSPGLWVYSLDFIAMIGNRISFPVTNYLSSFPFNSCSIHGTFRLGIWRDLLPLSPASATTPSKSWPLQA